MSSRKSETNFQLKRVNPIYIVVDENIHEALDHYSLALYMTFRYESDFRELDSCIQRSAKFLYEKAKISRAQFYRCLNKLEDFGLIERDENNGLGSVSFYHVAQKLYYFNTDCKGVSGRDRGGVSDRDTDQYLLRSNINITTSDNLNLLPEEVTEVVNAYHEELPELPKIRKVDLKLKSQLKKMIKDWPSYQKEGKKFSVESFKDYLNLIKQHYPWFLKPYRTESGSQIKCTLRKITREINITKFVNGEFSG
jgi:hypothetical protein